MESPARVLLDCHRVNPADREIQSQCLSATIAEDFQRTVEEMVVLAWKRIQGRQPVRTCETHRSQLNDASRSDNLLPPIQSPHPAYTASMITSLGRTASPLAPCRAEWCRRTLSTSAYAETSSSSPMPPRLHKKTHPRNGKVNAEGGPPRIFVRPWDGVPSMIDGFAMLRGIENRYGKVKSFKFMRVC